MHAGAPALQRGLTQCSLLLGAAQDRERAKRERGQSSIGTWKSEAEMVLRQQYDS